MESTYAVPDFELPVGSCSDVSHKRDLSSFGKPVRHSRTFFAGFEL